VKAAAARIDIQKGKEEAAFLLSGNFFLPFDFKWGFALE
jgi:hypothetical protein